MVMIKSDIVEVDGVFVGTAILQNTSEDRAGHRFFAIDDRVRPLHGAVLPSLSALRSQAAQTFHAANAQARRRR